MAITWNNGPGGSGRDPGEFPFHMSPTIYSQLRTYCNNRYQHAFGSGTPVSILSATADKPQIAVFLQACRSALVNAAQKDSSLVGFKNSAWANYDGKASTSDPFSFSASDLDNTNIWRGAIEEMREAVEEMIYVRLVTPVYALGFSKAIMDQASQTVPSGGTWDETVWSPQTLPAYPNSNATLALGGYSGFTKLTNVKRTPGSGIGSVPTNADVSSKARGASFWKVSLGSIRSGHQIVEISTSEMSNAIRWHATEGDDGYFGNGVPATMTGVVQIRAWVDNDSPYASPDVNRADGTLITELKDVGWPANSSGQSPDVTVSFPAINLEASLSLTATPQNVYLKLYAYMNEDPQEDYQGWGWDAVSSGFVYTVDIDGLTTTLGISGQEAHVGGPVGNELSSDLTMRYVIVD